MPTGWTAADSAVSRQILGITTIDGVTGLLVRYSGTPNSTGAQTLQFGSDVIAVGTTVAIGVHIALVEGTLANVTNILLRCSGESGGTSFSPGASLARITNVRTTTSTASSTGLRWNYANTTTPVFFTLFIGWPTREHAPFPSSPILPPVGAPAASTRGADLVSATLASLGIGESGACTILGVVTLPQNAPAGVNQFLAQIDAGNDISMFRLYNQTESAAIRCGSSVLAPSLGNMTAGSPLRFGIAIDGAGRIAGCINGGAVQSSVGGPTSGMSILRIGNNAGNTAPAHGLFHRLDVLQTVLSDSDLAARVATLPTT
jgi:hypothetical protein